MFGRRREYQRYRIAVALLAGEVTLYTLYRRAKVMGGTGAHYLDQFEERHFLTTRWGEPNHKGLRLRYYKLTPQGEAAMRKIIEVDESVWRG